MYWKQSGRDVLFNRPDDSAALMKHRTRVRRVLTIAYIHSYHKH